LAGSNHIMLQSSRPARALTLIITAALLASVSGCGRRGTPEAPPYASVLSTDEQGATVESKPDGVPDRPFILDPLLR